MIEEDKPDDIIITPDWFDPKNGGTLYFRNGNIALELKKFRVDFESKEQWKLRQFTDPSEEKTYHGIISYVYDSEEKEKRNISQIFAASLLTMKIHGYHPHEDFPLVPYPVCAICVPRSEQFPTGEVDYRWLKKQKPHWRLAQSNRCSNYLEESSAKWHSLDS